MKFKARVPYTVMPENNESWAEMKARHKKDSRTSDTVAMLLLFFVIAPFVIYLIFQALDKAAK
jgi:hypothetical protein